MSDEKCMYESELEITVRLTNWILSRIELLCEQGIFTSVSEFLAYAAREALRKMLKMLKDDIELRRKYSKELYSVEE